jgi:GLPGLI family protein
MKYIILLSSIFSLSFGQNTQMGKIEYTEYFGDHEKVNYSMSFSETFSIYEQNTINDDGIEIINGFKEPQIKRKYYTNLQSKEILFIEGIAYLEILTRDTINIVWELHEEQKRIGEFNCLKATTNFKKNNYIAWFTTEIPFSFGPWKFNGLPGIILEISDETNFYQIIATKIRLEKSQFSLSEKLVEFIKPKPKTMVEYNYLKKREDEDIYNLLISKAGRETYLKITTDYTGFLREPFD